MGAEAGLFAQSEDSALEALFDVSFGVKGAAGAIEEGGMDTLSLGPAFFPFVEGFTGDAEAKAG